MGSTGLSVVLASGVSCVEGPVGRDEGAVCCVEGAVDALRRNGVGVCFRFGTRPVTSTCQGHSTKNSERKTPFMDWGFEKKLGQ